MAKKEYGRIETEVDKIDSIVVDVYTGNMVSSAATNVETNEGVCVEGFGCSSQVSG